jgi:hypothetical protein
MEITYWATIYRRSECLVTSQVENESFQSVSFTRKSGDPTTTIRGDVWGWARDFDNKVKSSSRYEQWKRRARLLVVKKWEKESQVRSAK